MSDNIEDLYPLSPLQGGMLFHALAEPGQGLYFNQLVCELRGPLELEAFIAAWKGALDAHPVLRTALVWEDVDEPVQVVLREVDLPVRHEDWRGLSREALDARLAAFLKEDQREGFDLSSAPLVRLALLRTEDAAWRFVFSHSHLMLDGWSLPLLLRDVFALYGGKARSLMPPRPYRDFIAWLGEKDAGQARDFWTKSLAGFTEPTPLEFGAAPVAGSGRGERTLRLGAEETSVLEAFARRRGLTVGTLVQAAWALLLGRSSGRDDVLFGVTVAGRPGELRGVEDMVGLFINTIPARVRLTPAMTVDAWLRELQDWLLEARQHEHTPLVEVRRWSEAPAGAALFESLVVVENYPLDAALTSAIQGIEVRDIRSVEVDNHPLSLAAVPGRELVLRINYSSERFDAATVERMQAQLRHLLRALAAGEGKPLWTLSLLDGEERRRVLVEWNETAREYPRDATLAEVFASVVARYPDKVALEFGDAKLTYAQLDARANQLAWHLRGLGVSTDARVAVALERSLELIVALVAILKAGGAYVPLDPAYPRERLAWMVEDAKPQALITTHELLVKLPASGMAVVVLEEASLSAQPTHAPPVAAMPQSLAYIDFTSGSTGRPKGVGTPQAGVLRTVFGVDYAKLGPEETLLLIAPISFDASTLEVWGALLHGAKLAVFPPHAPSDVYELEGVLKKHGVTTLHLTAGLFTQVVDTHLEGLRTVKQLLTGGDVVSAPHVRRVLEELRIPVTACYGPTETTLFASCHRMTEASQVGASVPIGRPIGNTQAYVLDASGQPVPAGVVGELYVGGDGVARGYVEQPALTAERFVPDGFSGGAGARLYRTGDLARWRKDGVLEFLGRADAQVKVRGYRIELAEVESALQRREEVREAVVVAREDGPGGKRLVAYVTAREGREVEPQALRTYLGATLPEYMVPSAVVVLEALPLTSNGKVDRKALPAPESTRAFTRKEHVAPRDATEETLATIWSEVLRVPQVSIHDDFFELGGDSILSLQIIARARAAGLHLAPKQLFQHPTIARLAAVVSTASSTQAEQGTVEGAVPLTPIQHAYLEDHASEEPHHFNQAVMLVVRRRLDASLLEAALRKVVEHHDALRMRFTRDDAGHWHQHNAGAVHGPTLKHLDLTAVPEAGRSALMAQVAAELHASFQLDAPPLLRAALFDSDREGDARLLLVAHHLVVDTISWRVLVEDLEVACLALMRGQAPALPPKTTSFKEWAERLHTHALSEALNAELSYWQDEARARVPSLPREGASAPATVASARFHSVSLELEETRALLREVPTAWRAQVQEVLLTALCRALSSWTGHSRFLVDTEGHGREDLFSGVDLSRTVGWFTSVYPLLLEVPEGASLGDTLRAVRDGVRRLPGRGLGHGLLRHLRQDGRLRSLPRAEVSFNYLGQLDASLAASTLFALSQEPSGPAVSPRAVREHLLDVNAYVQGERLHVSFTYSPHLHGVSVVQGVAEAFLQTLRALIATRASEDARRYTPSDFPLARLSQPVLDTVVPSGTPIEDVYPLSPLQQGMLLQTLLAPTSGVYVTQLGWTFAAHLDMGAFRRAWESVIERHAVLRTSFVWEGLDEPMQRVHPSAALSIEEHDWIGLPSSEQDARFESLLLADRARGFDVRQPPLMRITVARLDARVHRVLWTHHHLLMDGWSLGVLFRELLATYGALREGRSIPTGRAPAYRDYIAWLQEQSESQAEAYWRQTLRGFTSPTPLPGLLSVSRQGAARRKDTRSLSLRAEETHTLQSFARQHQLTANTVVQAAWALALSRHTGQSDVVFGATGSGRSASVEDIENTVGLFINTVPARIQITRESPVLAWLKDLHTKQLELRQYEHSSLVRIQGWSEVPRGTALFESLFIFENYPVDSAVGSLSAGLDIRDVAVREQADTALEAVVVPGERLSLNLAYDTSRFDPDLLDGLLRHWATALREFVARPERRLGDVTLLDGEERRRVLVEWNETAREYPRDATLAEVFASVVARYPDKVALEFEDAKLTYAQLDARANQLAWHLRGLGVSTDARVAVALERSLELIVALVAILKAGGAYVPLDPAYPRERLAWMVEDAKPQALITTHELLVKLPASGMAVVVLEEASLSVQPTHAPPVAALPQSLAYIDFTSGSTGRPKGVGTPQAGVLRTVFGVDYARLGPEETLLLIAPISFDASTLEVWGALLHGAKLAVFPPHAPSDVHELESVLKKHGVTTLHLTAGLFTQVVDTHLEGLRTVKQLLTGGDVVSAPHVKRVLEELRIPVTACYGPTETTLFASCHRMTEASQVGASVPIGRPIGNTQAYVLDASGQPVPAGVVGELYVGGDGVARGYVEQPALTAERFVPDGFSGVAGARLYRTGDLARWRKDGVLEFLGRADAQVKVRGYRIELAEVESALQRREEVREAVVMAREDGPGGKRLVAYVTAREGREVEPQALRTYLGATLPEYMVPSAVVVLEALPLTSNGKVDRKALPAPDFALARAEVYVEPRTDTERTLAGLFEEVLGVKQVGLHGNFFELGGHSLLATRAVSRLRAAFGIELPLRELFEAPTVLALAERIDCLTRTGSGLFAAPPLKAREDRSGPPPLSFAQQRLWFLDQLKPGSALYNIPSAVRLTGPLDSKALERSFEALVRRHESLRTTFRTEAGVPVQVITESPVLDWRELDLSTLPESEARLHVARESLRPFDLEQGPLFRPTLLKLSAEDHVLVLVLHHIVSDGWSTGVLVREVGALYDAFSRGLPSPLPTLPIQYADYAVWQRGWLSGEVMEEQLGWWKAQLAGAPPHVELPTDFPRPPSLSNRGSTVQVRLSRELSDALKVLAQGEGATPFMLLLAAFQVLLSRYSGQEDIVVGSPIAGRRHAETEGLIGFFVNTLVLRARPEGSLSFLELLRQVRETTLGAYEHQDVPFEKLVEELQPVRDLGRSPLFQVLFVLQNAPMQEVLLPSLAIRPLEGGVGDVSKFELSLNLSESPEGFFGHLQVASDLFTEATGSRLMRHFQVLLEAIASAPEQRLSSLPLLTPTERQQVLHAWNDTGPGAPLDGCFHHAFERQASLTPAAPAVRFEDTVLSFAQLEGRANQLAWHLRSLGVGPDVRVALCLERSVDSVVALLGIMKAGGAYVPLDPAWPEQRLALTLQDCAAPVLLAHQRVLGSWTPAAVRVVCLDASEALPASLPSHSLAVAVSVDNLAYVIYTSGSTGAPKGVMVQHRSVLNLRHALACSVYAGQPSGLRVSANAPLSFDASVKQLVQLLDGHCVCIVPEETRQDPRALRDWLRRFQVDVLDCTPSLLRLLVEEGLLDDEAAPRLLVPGGEAIDEALWQRLAAAPRTRTFNVYGPTECTVDSTAFSVSPGTRPTIGGPLANIRAYVLDAHLQPVPIGVPGELFVSGAGLARGYLGRPALTAERFLPDAFSPTPGARMYRTGDRVRWLADGTLEYLGRTDFQVKLRGFRIELGEIEAVLAQHPSVRQALVLVREDAAGDQRLVAYVIATGVAPDAPELRAFLKQRLPEYMVPSAFVPLESFPLTPNGKVDRRALPAPEGTSQAGTYVPPTTPTEEQLAALWAEVLRVERVGRFDDFFALGGHSLLATQVVSRLRGLAGVDLPLRELFESPTVAGLAARVDALARASTGASLAPPLRPVSRTGPLPLSFAQQRLWFLDRLQPDSPFYNMPIVLWLEGTLDTGALERGVTELVRRHEVLRTTFEEGPVQVIHPHAPVPLAVVDLTSLPEDLRESEARRLAGEEVRRPFDLRRGPLLRAMLLRVSASRHLLVLNMHHIVSDGWSLGVLVRESAALYAAFASGLPSPLPELPVQYADYAAWQRGWLRGDALEAQLSWWREHLSGAPPALELPTDFPRPAVPGLRGAMLTRVLPRALTDSLNALCRREGTTLFMALLAGFEVVLSRYSGQDDFVVGTDIANRNRAETEGLIGFFINQLALRARLDGDPTFRELLGRVRQATLGAYAHQDLPFEELVRALNPERGQGHAPLFQVKLVLQNQPVASLEVPGLMLRGEHMDAGTSRLDLTVSVAETARGLEVGCEYRTDLFEADTIDRMVRHLGTVLEAVASRPESRLSDLPLLAEAEQRQVLVEWNATERDFPRDTCAHQLFEAQAARAPEAVALRFEGLSLTYAELDRRANRLAHHLRALGVRPEVPVALCLERSLELVVGILGILKAGGAWVPMDPSYPVERLTYMLRDCAAPVLVTTEAIADELPAGSEQLVLLDAEAALIDARPDTAPTVDVRADNLAYVIYTSGSTGRPKGTLLQHRGLCNTALTAGREHGFHPGSRVLQYAAFGFDASVAEVFGALLAGATLVLAPRERLLPGVPLRTLLREESITAVTLTPSVLAQLEPEDFPALETLISAGEACTPELVERWGSRVRMLNAYGPTEVTVCATLAGPLRPGQRLTIGRPWANVRAYVLDASLRSLPVGVPGELCVGGVGLARGYLGQPALSAERFVPDPFSGAAGARMYRTGDRARWLADGTLEYLGRIDQQVKLRGFRIELGEVESALAQHPSVREAVAAVREDAPGERRLVAYVVADEGDSLDVASLRQALKQRLPEHMVPAAFAVLPALPLTPNGKVDRKALPAPEGARTSATREYVAPRIPLEEQLAALWAELLHVERVGVHDDFFELGGHSLLATQLVARLRDSLGVELPLRVFFEAPTLEALASRVEQAARSLALPALRPVPRGGPLPLSFAQQRLWFLDRLQPGDASYNVPSVLRVEGRLDVAALERAFTELVRRHESLRTRFPDEGGVPVQVIDAPGPVALQVMDLRTREDCEAEARRLAREEAARPFDLSHGPLLRVSLLKLAEEQHLLLLTLHHIICDGWSSGVLVRELEALYVGFVAGRPSPLPELPLQYADYCVWQREWLRDEVLESQLTYWKGHLAGAPHALELPTDFPRPPVSSSRGASFEFHFSPELSRGLQSLCRSEGVTLFMALLGAFQVVLARHSGQDDVVVGTPIAGRRFAELEGLVGLFINTLALRTRLDGDPSFRAVLGRVRESTLGAQSHQDIPFEKLVEELRPQRDLGRSPLFQVMLILQNLPDAGTQRSSSLSLHPVDVGNDTVKFDLTVGFVETPEGVRGQVGYRTDLFREESVRRLVDHLRVLLETVTVRPEVRLSELRLLTGEERRRLLVDFQGREEAYPREVCLHSLIEAQVSRTPEAEAVRFEASALSYAQLDARANQLARHLRALGVGPETRVGVCLERSLELVVALLGVLKAGGAYVPLDPAYPRERLAWMLEDSDAPVLLTQRRLVDVLPPHSARVLCMDADWDAVAREDASRLVPLVGSDSLAYVIFTSGSTGRPKGAMNAHAGVVNRLLWMQREYGLTSADTVLQKTPFSFDVSVWEFFWPLMTGARLVLARPGGHQDPAYLVRLMAQERVTTAHFVPSMLQAFVEEPGLERLTDLRRMVCSGEALPAPVVRRAQARLPVAEVHNLYGPTEAAVDVTYFACPRGDGLSVVPIGRPVANTRIYVVDRYGQLAPVGVPGELLIGGVQVGRGYWRRPELTSERFVPDAFSGVPGARLYRTGDLARWLPDGTLEYLGRLDFQVKLRGFRIELGEVEAALRAHPDVGDAVVVARDDGPGGMRLVAYVVPTAAVGRSRQKGASPERSAMPESSGTPSEGPSYAASEPTVAELRTFLAQRLPAYMVPSALVVMKALPLTPSGKVDRKALPAPESGTAVPSAMYEPPRTPLEESLVAIWAQVLRMEPGRVGRRDDFFALGGHSLLATQVVARLREVLGVDVPLRALFEAPTVERLSSWLQGPRSDGPARHCVTLHAEGTGTPVFLVHAVGGAVGPYRELARRLKRPLYGLQASGLDGREPPLDTVEALAQRYVEAVRAVRSEGPYVLGGWSMGGIVAFEMARELERQGQRVELLVLLDSFASSEGVPVHEPDGALLLAGMAMDLARTAGADPTLRPELLEGLSDEEQLAQVARHAREAGWLPPEIRDADLRAWRNVMRANLRAQMAWRPGEYRGPVLLLRAKDSKREHAVDATHGWARWATSRLTVEDVPGDHYSTLRAPHVDTVAARLMRHLDEASEDSTGGKQRGEG
ncbi:non-ribosomal peptide synthase/polyketide synthase [Pyxidicoccus parkwayensis]|uniref:Non-ribosomal peptide synthase/polyketide synthase n=1 Tax=Pyxidicoccus parkwayensis TaxID=2813578 RepID=A0ABX7P5Q0_9BACT|nr:non-ribosomal peptide synthetase [Pyxidicoccus parkwaysis]QSQ25805.1 non-ribosomal peptide synthase/polyketide synthase [Pyxidicoccus parkwaysis]